MRPCIEIYFFGAGQGIKKVLDKKNFTEGFVDGRKYDIQISILFRGMERLL
jgi:hypothetical protein